jgi:rhodanese-related sulfurtransferase
MLISPSEVKALIDSGTAFVFLDTRTREEHEAVAIEGSEFMTQERQQELFGTAKETDVVVLYDHTGGRVLDTCAWFQGHGLKGARGMIGGIDAWSKEIDKTVPRYRLEMD